MKYRFVCLRCNNVSIIPAKCIFEIRYGAINEEKRFNLCCMHLLNLCVLDFIFGSLLGHIECLHATVRYGFVAYDRAKHAYVEYFIRAFSFLSLDKRKQNQRRKKSTFNGRRINTSKGIAQCRVHFHHHLVADATTLDAC